MLPQRPHMTFMVHSTTTTTTLQTRTTTILVCQCCPCLVCSADTTTCSCMFYSGSVSFYYPVMYHHLNLCPCQFMYICVYPYTPSIIIRSCRYHLILSMIIQSYNIVIFELVIRFCSTIFPNPIFSSHDHTLKLYFIMHIYY